MQRAGARLRRPDGRKQPKRTPARGRMARPSRGLARSLLSLTRRSCSGPRTDSEAAGRMRRSYSCPDALGVSRMGSKRSVVTGWFGWFVMAEAGAGKKPDGALAFPPTICGAGKGTGHPAYWVAPMTPHAMCTVAAWKSWQRFGRVMRTGGEETECAGRWACVACAPGFVAWSLGGTPAPLAAAAAVGKNPARFWPGSFFAGGWAKGRTAPPRGFTRDRPGRAYVTEPYRPDARFLPGPSAHLPRPGWLPAFVPGRGGAFGWCGCLRRFPRWAWWPVPFPGADCHGGKIASRRQVFFAVVSAGARPPAASARQACRSPQRREWRTDSRP